jgi:hypothetical protein
MSAEPRIETDAEREVARFLASQPAPEAIVAFHPSREVAARMHALVEAERAGQLSDQERLEMETYLHIEHLMRLVKAEAQRRLSHQAQ